MDVRQPACVMSYVLAEGWLALQNRTGWGFDSQISACQTYTSNGTADTNLGSFLAHTKHQIGVRKPFAEKCRICDIVLHYTVRRSDVGRRFDGEVICSTIVQPDMSHLSDLPCRCSACGACTSDSRV